MPGHLEILGKIESVVKSFFALHKYVASHCMRNRFQNDAARRVTPARYHALPIDIFTLFNYYY